jgi:hypothetical protein
MWAWLGSVAVSLPSRDAPTANAFAFFVGTQQRARRKLLSTNSAALFVAGKILFV